MREANTGDTGGQRGMEIRVTHGWTSGQAFSEWRELEEKEGGKADGEVVFLLLGLQETFSEFSFSVQVLALNILLVAKWLMRMFV